VETTLYIRLKEVLQERNLSQKQLAQMTGLREATVSEITRNTKTSINVEHLAKILRALNINDLNKLIKIQ
jgi:putative transcriptional regulator